MVRKIGIIILIFHLTIAFSCLAQEETEDIFKELNAKKKKTKKIIKRDSDQVEEGWNPHLASGLLISQSNYTNWTSGGENSLAWTIRTDGLLIFKRDLFSWSNQLNIAFGKTRLSSKGNRKTEDRLEFETTGNKKLRELLRPFISVFLQTQLAPGYKYSYDKDKDVEIRRQISGFWDPAYVFQSAGLSIVPFDGSTVRLGLAAKEIFTRKFREYSDGVWYSFQSGMEFTANINRDILKNTKLKSNLRLFSSFEKFEQIQMIWDNRINLKFNDFFSANLNAFLRYDPDVSLNLQIKEILGIGVEYIFL